MMQEEITEREVSQVVRDVISREMSVKVVNDGAYLHVDIYLGNELICRDADAIGDNR